VILLPSRGGRDLVVDDVPLVVPVASAQPARLGLSDEEIVVHRGTFLARVLAVGTANEDLLPEVEREGEVSLALTGIPASGGVPLADEEPERRPGVGTPRAGRERDGEEGGDCERAR
jgi:hypothetical protein